MSTLFKYYVRMYETVYMPASKRIDAWPARNGLEKSIRPVRLSRNCLSSASQCSATQRASLMAWEVMSCGSLIALRGISPMKARCEISNAPIYLGERRRGGAIGISKRRNLFMLAQLITFATSIMGGD